MDQPYGMRDCAFRDPAGNLLRYNQARQPQCHVVKDPVAMSRGLGERFDITGVDHRSGNRHPE